MSKKKKNLKEQIKEMEDKKRIAVPVIVDKKMSFNAWYHIRKALIPKHHRQEILIADFSSRGLGKEATMEEFDKALELYGIKLK